jgi:hypothetical protein
MFLRYSSAHLSSLFVGVQVLFGPPTEVHGPFGLPTDARGTSSRTRTRGGNGGSGSRHRERGGGIGLEAFPHFCPKIQLFGKFGARSRTRTRSRGLRNLSNAVAFRNSRVRMRPLKFCLSDTVVEEEI